MKVKKKTVREIVYQFAKEQKLKFENYKEDYKLFSSLNKEKYVGFSWFKFYLKESNLLKIVVSNNVTIKEKEKISLFSLKNYHPSKDLFVSMKTGKPIDLMISKTGGFMPGTTIMFDGGPGTGKTTTGTDTIIYIKRNHPKKKILFLNSEMKPLDLAAERLERPLLDEIENIFLLSEYNDAKSAIENILLQGWDFILVDSFDHICRRLTAQGILGVEKFMLELFSKHNDNKFNTGHHSTFFVIQQVTKGGTFKGSNSQKHDTTAFIHAEFDEEGKRHLWAEKNRRNGNDINRKLYYTLLKGDVIYDIDNWNKAKLIDQRAEQEKSNIAVEDKNFDFIFAKHDKIKEVVKIKKKKILNPIEN